MKKKFRPALIGVAAALALAAASRDLNPVSLITIGDGTDPTTGGGGDGKAAIADDGKVTTGVAGIEVREGDPAAGESQQQQQTSTSATDQADANAATAIPTGDRQQE